MCYVTGVRMLLGWLAVGLLVALASGEAQSQGNGAQKPARPRTAPVITSLDLHLAMIDPASDALFNVGTAPPKTDQEWITLRNHAIVLAESAALLNSGGRARSGAWVKMSQTFAETGLAALKAARAKDVDGVLQAGDRMIATCEDCHEVYRDRGRSMRK